MIMGSTSIVKLLLLHMYGKNSIRAFQLSSLREKYAAKLIIEEKMIPQALKDIPVIV
jgi:hypothetical protein